MQVVVKKIPSLVCRMSGALFMVWRGQKVLDLLSSRLRVQQEGRTSCTAGGNRWRTCSIFTAAYCFITKMVNVSKISLKHSWALHSLLACIRSVSVLQRCFENDHLGGPALLPTSNKSSILDSSICLHWRLTQPWGPDGEMWKEPVFTQGSSLSIGPSIPWRELHSLAQENWPSGQTHSGPDVKYLSCGYKHKRPLWPLLTLQVTMQHIFIPSI